MRRKPFLKWAGGKFRVLEKILHELPQGCRLVEPFAGSCAVYLNFPSEKALICDVNADLIYLYQHLQTEGEAFIGQCKSYFSPENNTKKAYIAFREKFNESREPWLRGCLFLYLNRHAFNGLVRYNSKGEFNVPFGRYVKPYFPLKELREFYLKTQGVETEFACRDFREVFSGLKPGDVVYCDPPYVPLSATAAFTAYSGQNFREKDQRELAGLAASAQRRGIPVLVSNHDTETTRGLYVAAEIRRFNVQRFISCNGDARGEAPELLAIYR